MTDNTQKAQGSGAVAKPLVDALASRGEDRFKTIAFVHRHEIIAALSQPPEASEVEVVLSCDVMLPPATTVRAGCSFETLRLAMSLPDRPKHFAHPPKASPMRELQAMGQEFDAISYARELWWPHHESRTREIALADLDSGSLGKVTLEFQDFVAIVSATPPKAEASEAVMTLVQARRIVDAVTEHCRGADFSCDMKAATKSVLALAQPARDA